MSKISPSSVYNRCVTHKDDGKQEPAADNSCIVSPPLSLSNTEILQCLPDPLLVATEVQCTIKPDDVTHFLLSML